MSRILAVVGDRTTRHQIKRILEDAGFSVAFANDARIALRQLRASRYRLVLLDLSMRGNGHVELLDWIRARRTRPTVIVISSDTTAETLLAMVRRDAFNFLQKPLDPSRLLEAVTEAFKTPRSVPIEVISATPEWVELLLPCTSEAADRLHDVIDRLASDLPADMRETIAYAFRELLLNAIEWGGKFDPSRKVRVSYLRARRMILYRIADPGLGFDIGSLPHAAIGQPSDVPIAHLPVREHLGIRPGGFGLLTVRTGVDELVFNERRNEVVFVKYLD